ncbi:helix-turn-helix domain-containing protein [Frankia sp. CiP1_Cm_nod2]|uniref:helix-turn-helix domain-containing protein n=1 Tax=Frankia sp. CiP1_Cm_nod2 TaxID=2897161 RepID=UPI00202589E3
MTETGLGDRLAQVRRRRGLTQEELAERSGVSVAVINKLEQGQRDSVRVATLHALARGLDIRTAELFEGAAYMDDTEEHGRAALLPLRRVLEPSPAERLDPAAPVSAVTLRAMVEDAARLYNDSRLNEAVTELPAVLTAARAAAAEDDESDGMEANRLLASAYIIAGSVLIQLRYEDLAYGALRQAGETAEMVGDDVIRGSTASYLAWIFLRQGRFADAENTAVQMAEEIEPSLTRSTPAHISVWGRLLVRASACAARNNRPERARDLLNLARSAAVRVERDRLDYGEYFASFGPTTVATMEVEMAMTIGDAARALALALARNVPPTTHIPQSTWSRHLLAVAEAQTAVREYNAAIQTVGQLQGTAPEWLRNQRLAHQIVRDLLDAATVRRARKVGLAGLAASMGVRP